MNNRHLMLSGITGLLAAVLVGGGEFLLHFDALARYDDTGAYTFMLDVPATRITAGHFMAVAGLPLYLIGCWHIYMMLNPAHKNMALIAFLISAYGFAVGGVWIGSRAIIGGLMHLPADILATYRLIEFYQFHYENLLTVIRSTTIVLSVLMMGMIASGKTLYPRWMALLNPAMLILGAFLLFRLSPAIGKYIMPIGLNMAFFIFFAFSIHFTRKRALSHRKVQHA